MLLVAGGLLALQRASITAVPPFSVIMLLMLSGLVRGLREEVVGLQFVGAGHPVHGGLEDIGPAD